MLHAAECATVDEMSALDGIVFRTATEADWPASTRLFELCFGNPQNEFDAQSWRRVIDPDSILLAVDSTDVVGETMDIPMTVTVPGGAPVRAAGVTSVAVAPTHRRRGILREMYTRQHRRIRAAETPLAVLTASEGGIYGRFGYGPATIACDVRVDRRFAALRAPTADFGRVRAPGIEEFAQAIPGIYDRWRRTVPGAQSRPDAMYERLFQNRNTPGSDRPHLFGFLHADGYVLFTRTSDAELDSVRVFELRAVTPDAYAALWRALLGLDLVGPIEATLTPDDPLPYLLTDGRQVHTTGRTDSLWLRIMDVPAALEARDYAADLDTVIDVRDEFLDAGGTFALTVRDRKAICVPTGEPAKVAMDLDVLGSLYLGAHRATSFARAHRLWTHDDETLRRLDLAFTSERPAAMGWPF